MFEIVILRESWVKGQIMTLTFCTHKSLMAFTINGHGGHFGHVTQLISKAPINFHTPVPNS